jgi:L-asparagine oxygenase
MLYNVDASRGAAAIDEKMRVSYSISKAGSVKSATVRLTSQELEAAWTAAKKLRTLGKIDDDPVIFQKCADQVVKLLLPALYMDCVDLARVGVPQIAVVGLPIVCPLTVTPSDGVVVEDDVRAHVGFLVSLLGAAGGLAPFAYASENGGRVLRAVSPVAALKSSASSQGSSNDLGWHNDNANQPMVQERTFVPGGPILNPAQAFVCIRPKADTPMETLALDDVLVELEEAYGHDVVVALQRPDFEVRWPDSHKHGGAVAVSGVPLLVKDELGHVHSRYHEANVTASGHGAAVALQKFREVVGATTSMMEVHGQPGELLIYSNTRIMHRRRAFEAKFDGADRYYLRVYLAPRFALKGHHLID